MDDMHNMSNIKKVWSIGGMIVTGQPEALGETHYTVWVVDE